MHLASLIGPDVEAPPGVGESIVTGLTADSRAVIAGSVFAALSGSKADGSQFIADAAQRGAVAVLAGMGVPVPELKIPVLRSRDPRRSLALMASRFHPRQPRHIVAVTGTSGKTSVAEFTRQILAARRRAAASLGTIGVVRPGGATYGALTTPDPVKLHAMLDELAGAGVTDLAMEASSHGLDQRRLDGVRLTAGAFTNLGRDHLDYHPTIEDYLAAKARLFDTLLQPGQTAVVCADAPYAADIIGVCRKRGLHIVTTGTGGEHIRLVALSREGFAQSAVIEVAGYRHTVRVPLIGDYQVANALVAVGLAAACGLDVHDAVTALPDLTGVAGRLEIVGQARGALGVVDYAHKPDALQAALSALRPFASGKLVCVFGCGGDRDPGKRPIMGRIAVEAADTVIVTDDNPRGENPAAIRAAILAAAPGAREIGDRAEAIRVAVGELAAGDVLVVAGKGHEHGQIIGTTTIPFSDHDVLGRALEAAR